MEMSAEMKASDQRLKVEYSSPRHTEQTGDDLHWQGMV
jgi:hypothetical protein